MLPKCLIAASSPQRAWTGGVLQLLRPRERGTEMMHNLLSVHCLGDKHVS